MRHTLAIAVAAAGLGLGVGWFVWSRSGGEERIQPPATPESPRKPGGNATPEPELAPLPRLIPSMKTGGVSIPLDKVYATSGQEGLRTIPAPPDERWKGIHEGLFNHLGKSGISTTFLVVATDVHIAMHETHQAYQGRRGVDAVYPRGDKYGLPTTVWLFVLVRHESAGRVTEVLGVDVGDHVITVRVRLVSTGFFASGGAGLDAFWVELPRLDPRRPWVIRVEDGASDEPALTRRVFVRYGE